MTTLRAGWLGHTVSMHTAQAPVQLNIDLGELEAEPEALYAAAHLANVACGGHAGTRASMRRAIALCQQWDCALGAHPAFPDREHFGRRHVRLPMEVLEHSLREQLQSLKSLADEAGVPLRACKAHGALYHAADDNEALARLFCGLSLDILGPELVILGPEQGLLQESAEALGLAFWVEGFADRGRLRQCDGRWALIPRSEEGALLEDARAVQAQVQELLAEGRCQTLCVHGDSPQALAIAQAVRQSLDAWNAGLCA